MKIKTIFTIVAVLAFLQVLPLPLTLVSEDFKTMLIADVFGENPSADAVTIFENFVLVLGLIFTGLIFLLIGARSFSDEATLRRLSFLFSVIWGFAALPDLISFIKNDGFAAPLPVIIMGLVSYCLLLYGSRKGTV